MPVLLDTHAFLWWTQNDARLSSRARRKIAGSECFLSVASCWELAIKLSLGRLRFDRPLREFLAEQLQANSISLLPIEFRHTIHVAELPWHHRDPFDRLLLAQALGGGLTLISADTVFDEYGKVRFW